MKNTTEPKMIISNIYIFCFIIVPLVLTILFSFIFALYMNINFYDYKFAMAEETSEKGTYSYMNRDYSAKVKGIVNNYGREIKVLYKENDTLETIVVNEYWLNAFINCVYLTAISWVVISIFLIINRKRVEDYNIGLGLLPLACVAFPIVLYCIDHKFIISGFIYKVITMVFEWIKAF